MCLSFSKLYYIYNLSILKITEDPNQRFDVSKQKEYKLFKLDLMPAKMTDYLLQTLNELCYLVFNVNIWSFIFFFTFNVHKTIEQRYWPRFVSDLDHLAVSFSEHFHLILRSKRTLVPEKQISLSLYLSISVVSLFACESRGLLGASAIVLSKDSSNTKLVELIIKNPKEIILNALIIHPPQQPSLLL